MKINLYPDKCDSWQFYRDWMPDKLLAIHSGGKFNPTAKNRRNHAIKLGYKAISPDFDAYNSKLDDIYAINTSAKVRQGNTMRKAYMAYPSEKYIKNTCEKHGYALVVAEKEGRWYGYAIIHLIGELCNISTFIGHKDYLKDGIMLLVMDKIIEVSLSHGCKVITYGHWYDGLPGLTYWKYSVGFKPNYLSE